MADDCNVYVAVQRDNANSGGLVYALSSASQSASLIAEIPGLARGIAYRPEDDTLFVTARDRLMALNTDGSNLRELDSVAAQYLNGMALAPANWGQLGGRLIVAQNTGDILAFDPEGGEGVVVASFPAFISDVVFDGQQLYVAAHSALQVLRVNPAGVSSTFVDLPCEPDGLAVEPGVRLFAACGREDAIYAVSLSTGTVSEVGSADLNPGWAPAGLFWNSGALMVIEETTGLNAIFP
jgi:DNA-binding beta-propeller fold protein YncE